MKLIIAICMLLSLSGFAKQNWGFSNVSVNYLDWSDRTTLESSKADFIFLELEGGAGFHWGEVYGFFDLENPVNGAKNEGLKERRTALKGVIRYNLGETGLSLYGHLYNFAQTKLTEQNRVMGLGYDMKIGRFIWKPFIAIHDVTVTNEYTNNAHSGMNGYMFGWIFSLPFKVYSQSFEITNWTEYEFDRNVDALPENWGINGSLGLWWHARKQLGLGIQYRYAQNKLGFTNYQNAMIYTIKYPF